MAHPQWNSQTSEISLHTLKEGNNGLYSIHFTLTFLYLCYYNDEITIYNIYILHYQEHKTCTEVLHNQY